MDFFAVINGIFTTDATNKIALYVDEPTEKTQKAIHGLVYTVFGGLMKRTTSEIGVNQLYNYLQKHNQIGSLSDNLVSTLKDPSQINAFIQNGNDAISHLLPALKSSIASMISSYAGIRNSSAISLLGITSTMVLDVLGKQVKEQKMDADRLAVFLFDQRENFVQKTPEILLPQLIEKLSIQQIVAGVAAPAKRIQETPAPIKVAPAPNPISQVFDNDRSGDGNDSPVGKIAVGVLIAALLGIGGYFVYQNSKSTSTETEASQVVDPTDSTRGSTSPTDTVARSLDVPVDTSQRITPATAATTAVAGKTATPAPAPVTPAAPVTGGGTLSAQLKTYLSDATAPKGRSFPLAGITFQPGSLSLATGSESTINELIAIMKAYPSAQIQLLGYANDAKGALTNKSLSFRRVNQIKQQLIMAGIDYVRIDAVGRGTGVPPRKPGDTTSVAKPGISKPKIDLRVVIK
ncbi:DUF937 domain-containing protein [Arsenicibacter rosenii]|uniref:Cell envelope biogenesis protein OmpA n=1 Tax=Arsenicibacter rosenii TaxID=1750698 RepID=A0A1S2VQ30_9BACT|nr:DUF937 domain-containing protein [Arsenicibacter rosenii]OIN59908.1 cell envelope biogenesis protein OmpA [Arsenicibacter rosenii]